MFCFWQKLEFLLPPLVSLFLDYSPFAYSFLKYKHYHKYAIELVFYNFPLDLSLQRELVCRIVNQRELIHAVFNEQCHLHWIFYIYLNSDTFPYLIFKDKLLRVQP